MFFEFKCDAFLFILKRCCKLVTETQGGTILIIGLTMLIASLAAVIAAAWWVLHG